ncbi:adenosylcobinamide-phosphate synthase CbiB [Thermoanaerobacter pentosaceus]|uniref:Cobalamin biosynthesis protein CobD n=1 Tax=Thermoanaerobacter pentosaceus TaxID=694059 RepID=A0ABT9M111_9THEO|nr:adenosylcobinamide-phosphate synthase CbiB [Thermoanaerobacter pentosaceus]MDP9749802.1 adenosylcobinamide-phosphate synthase [Thermoanaerobacter pentosaceus]
MEVVLAYLLDLLIGDPEGYPHPVRIIGKVVSHLESILRKYAKSNRALKIAGFILCGLTVTLAFAATYVLLYIAGLIHPYLKYALDVLIIYTCLATKDLDKAAGKVYEALTKGDIVEARRRLSYIVSRDTDRLDVENISRGAIETVAENISDGIIAPMFYAFIGGAPLAVFYKAASTLDSMVGYRNEKYLDLGFASAKLDDILNFIPARITGFLIVVAAFLLGYDYKNSWRIFLRDRLKHQSPNSAHGEEAVAGALNIQLGGLNYYFGKPEIKPTLGDGKEKITPQHMKDSIKIMYMTSSLGLVVFYIGRRLI